MEDGQGKSARVVLRRERREGYDAIKRTEPHRTRTCTHRTKTCSLSLSLHAHARARARAHTHTHTHTHREACAEAQTGERARAHTHTRAKILISCLSHFPFMFALSMKFMFVTSFMSDSGRTYMIFACCTAQLLCS